MLTSFLQYIDNEKLRNSSKSILLAVSGGKDSMVMLDLFFKSDLKVAVAHVNHNARGEESDGDEAFLNEHCAKLNLPFHVLKLDPSLSKSSNFQAKARELRYNWMLQLCKQNNYLGIATAHHANDHIESFFISLLRGAGMKGLSGISPKKIMIFRPILSNSRVEIDQYADAFKVAYREDSSNATEKYLRNKIRHTLIPQLTNIDPNYAENISDSMKIISDSNELLTYLVDHDTTLSNEVNGKLIIDLKKLRSIPAPATFLWHKLNTCGFSKSDLEDIVETRRSGASFYSPSHIAIIDRDQLIINVNQDTENTKEEIQILEPGCIDLQNGYQLHVKEVDHLSFAKEAGAEVLGFDTKPFPLTLRKRREGDFFKPLGMNGRKQKISDFVINNKLNYFEKEHLWLLTNNEAIVYVVPYRISEEAKVTSKSKYILEVKLVSLS